MESSPATNATTSRPPVRDAILDAVDRLLARYGYRKMTMDDIACEAGISKRTIYLNFTNKESVALASIDRVVQRLLEQLQALVLADLSAEERLAQMLRTRVLFRFDSVRDYYQSFDELFAALRPAYLARRDRYFEAEARVIETVLEDGRRAGAFDFVETRQTAHTLILATNSLLPYGLSPNELGERKAIETRLEPLTRLLVNGLRRGHRGPEGARQ